MILIGGYQCRTAAANLSPFMVPVAAIRVSRKRFAQDSPAKLALWRWIAVVLPPMQRILLAACVLLVLALEACASDDTAAVPPPAMRTTVVEDWQSAPSGAPKLRQSEVTLENNWPTARLRASVY
jgi:hypothetical protein